MERSVLGAAGLWEYQIIFLEWANCYFFWRKYVTPRQMYFDEHHLQLKMIIIKEKCPVLFYFELGIFVLFSANTFPTVFIYLQTSTASYFGRFFIAIQTADTVPHHHRQSRSSWYRKFKFFPVHFYLLFLTTCHFSLFFSWLSVGNMYMQGLTHTHMDIITSPPCPTQSPIATSGVVKRKKSGSLTTVMSLCVLCFIRSIKESKKIRKIKKGLAMVCL